MPIMFLFNEVVLKHTCCVMLFTGVLQLPWIRRTIFTYTFKQEIGIWMGLKDSHANIMCPNLLLIVCTWYVCVPRCICARICFANHCPSFFFLSVSWCFLFIKFGTASFIGQHLKTRLFLREWIRKIAQFPTSSILWQDQLWRKSFVKHFVLDPSAWLGSVIHTRVLSL